MIGWYIQMAVTVILCVMVCGSVMLYTDDGKRLGLWIARRMMAPIEREQAKMRAGDAAFPEAIPPLTGDWTRWRYVPMVGAWPSDPPELSYFTRDHEAALAYLRPETYWEPRRDHAVVLFRCTGCRLIAYGHAVPGGTREPAQ